MPPTTLLFSVYFFSGDFQENPDPYYQGIKATFDVRPIPTAHQLDVTDRLVTGHFFFYMCITVHQTVHFFRVDMLEVKFISC